MAYRNKTYVIFDGDMDMWAYAYMKGWIIKDHIDFNFHDAHELMPISTAQNETYIKSKLRERLANTKQAIVIIGESTKNLYRFVRWEIEICLNLRIPIIAVNLNGIRYQDNERCPPILKDTYTVHVPFRLQIIKYALDNFPRYHAVKSRIENGPLYYEDSIYIGLGIMQ
jgi:hypothetical protein